MHESRAQSAGIVLQMTKPLVSVVMIVCNVERFLAEAIESILDQTFRDFEFLIVDFGSTDNSKPIAASFAAIDERIKLHEVPHCSLPEARNAACGLAQGKYIAMPDADDISLPDRLKWQVEFMEAHPEVALLGGARDWIDSSGRHLFTVFEQTDDGAIRSDLAVRCAFSQTTILVRSNAFAFVGGYRAAFVQAEDYDFFLRISEHFQCANLRQVVAKFRVHARQLSTLKNTDQAICMLAAQISKAARKAGKPDPMDLADEITPALLARLGVSAAVLQTTMASLSSHWVRTMSVAGEYSLALKDALQFLNSFDLDCAQRRPVADLWLSVASLYWRKRQLVNALHALARAVAARPVVMGRPLKQMLDRLESSH